MALRVGLGLACTLRNWIWGCMVHGDQDTREGGARRAARRGGRTRSSENPSVECPGVFLLRNEIVKEGDRS